MEKEVNKYLSDLFKKIEPYILSDKESKKVSLYKTGFIMDKISRKRFRRKLTEGAREKIRKKIELIIKEDKPIHFTIPFGGYKHFWNPSHPEPDWAELFNFRFLTDYVLPILAVHKPGVILEYISEDLIITRMNNYPKESMDAYSKAFIQLFDWYKQFIPENLEIRYLRVGEKFDKDKIISAVEKLIPERIAEFKKLSDEEKQNELHRSGRSVMWDGEKDLTNLSEKEKEERIIESRVVELAYYDIESSPEFLGNYLWDDDHICICFSFGLSYDNVGEDLTLASNHGSIVDYWIGRGILTAADGRFIPRTISQNQYNNLKDKLVSEKTNLIELKNFQEIEVYKGTLDL